MTDSERFITTAGVAPRVDGPTPTRHDVRYVKSTDARARLRAWAGNGSIDLGGWLGGAESAWDFYYSVRDALRHTLGEPGGRNTKIAIYRVEDDASGERAPYSSASAFVMGDITE